MTGTGIIVVVSAVVEVVVGKYFVLLVGVIVGKVELVVGKSSTTCMSNIYNVLRITSASCCHPPGGSCASCWSGN